MTLLFPAGSHWKTAQFPPETSRRMRSKLPLAFSPVSPGEIRGEVMDFRGSRTMTVQRLHGKG